jgi:predicted ester cyclase
VTAQLTPKQLVRRYLKAMTHGKPGDLTKLISPKLVAVQGSERMVGAEVAEQYAAFYRQAFAGWKFEVEHMIAEGGWVAVTGASVGTVNATLPNLVPAGTPARVPWMARYRVVRGRIAEVHMLADTSSVARIPLQV